MSILNQLNGKQREAANAINGPLLILAGAGSGKTRTITYRIAHMVREREISPYQILAVTFTNKAAKEMRERVEGLIGEDAGKVLVSTFHSFGVRLLRMYSSFIGYNSNFNIYDSDDQVRIVKRILKELTLKSDMTPKGIVTKISKLKEEGQSPDDFEKSAGSYFDNNKVIAEVYKRYEAEVKSNNSMDFSDLLTHTYKLLAIPEVLEKIQERYRYIMVDEYQDTNNIQYKIIKKIASKYRNLCVVGDEDQSIYGFRGANIQNILDFEKDYPEAVTIKLEQNYRSTANILAAANSVIKNNTTSKGKKLWTDKKTGDLIKVYEAKNAYDEATIICLEMIKAHKKGIKYKDQTILYRTNAQSRIFEEIFLQNNIPYKIFGGMQFYQRKEVKDVLAYLSLINNPIDDHSLLRIINVPNRKIGDRTIEKLRAYQNEKKLTLLESLKYIDEIDGVRATTKVSIINFYNIIQELKSEVEIEHLSVSEILEILLEKTKFVEFLQEENEEGRVENIEELKNSIYEQEKSLDDHLSLREYLENVSLVSATDNLDENSDYVKLMTIHNSKGLEFPYVYLVGMEEEIFPGAKVNYDEKELEEERRLCYVAVTRAENQLFISHAIERSLYGRTDYFRARSRFLDEIPATLLEYQNKREEQPVKVEKTINVGIENFNPFKIKANSKYKVGQKIEHKKFGVGVIKALEENMRIIIKFPSGEKKIALAIAEKFIKKLD